MLAVSTKVLVLHTGRPMIDDLPSAVIIDRHIFTAEHLLVNAGKGVGCLR